MKLKFALLLIILVSHLSFAQDTTYRIMTYNIRYANDNPGEKWDDRKEAVAEMISFHSPDIFGVQEALPIQIDFLNNSFPTFSQVGVGRDDGKNQGEYSALFISEKFNILDSGTFWISETPDSVSLGWDAHHHRIATWAIVNQRDYSLFIINTHLDHQGILARKEGVKVLLDKIQILSKKHPIVLFGDFNFSKDFEGYKTLINSNLIVDSDSISENHYGTRITFNGFSDDLTGREKIDHIFVSPKLQIIHHAIIGDKFDGKYPSDHMPVIIDIKISN